LFELQTEEPFIFAFCFVPQIKATFPVVVADDGDLHDLGFFPTADEG
jgi:hypothetical protein